jgi:hypothetical protein
MKYNKLVIISGSGSGRMLVVLEVTIIMLAPIWTTSKILARDLFPLFKLLSKKEK